MASLVLRGAVDGIDDEDFDGRAGADELDAESIFERCLKEVSAGIVRSEPGERVSMI